MTTSIVDLTLGDLPPVLGLLLLAVVLFAKRREPYDRLVKLLKVWRGDPDA